ncbi:hypothetical protein BGZ63DRAFT_361579 [Mariannaea sp. PMI_226]|nr:hypothetical protein BGZ63DRAFT_361579 [Mariannaea sp. PMI_226]
MPEEPSSPPASAKDSQTYLQDLPDDIGPFRQLLEGYGNVAPSEVDAHLHSIRDKAWAAARFPCVGRWSFTNLRFIEGPTFEAVIARLKKPESSDILLDVACGLGQVIRKLITEGVDPTKLYGTDLLSEYLDLGFELFRDRDRLHENFIAADLLQSETGLSVLHEKVTMIHAANFFHLFDWEKQVQISSNIVKLLRPEAEDAMIFGRQIGRLDAGESKSWRSGHVTYLHNLDSLQLLWDEIGEKTGTKWRVDAKWIGKLSFQIPGYPDYTMYLGFVIRRL